jgi:lysozyme
MSMIVGNDVSHWQGIIDFNTYHNNSNFLIAKGTEGINFFDSQFNYNRDESRKYNLPFGSYHFARPSKGNPAVAEADYYLSRIGGLNAGEWLTLDYEDTYSGDVVGWCKTWLDRVQEKTGVKALIYLNESLIKGHNWSPVSSAGYGLWVAKYTYDPTDNSFVTGSWSFASCQQWTNQQTVPGIAGKCDGDVFFGTIDQFKKYGYQPPTPPTPTPTPPPVEIPDPDPIPDPETDYSQDIVNLQNQIDSLDGRVTSLESRVLKIEKMTIWDWIKKR